MAGLSQALSDDTRTGKIPEISGPGKHLKPVEPAVQDHLTVRCHTCVNISRGHTCALPGSKLIADCVAPRIRAQASGCQKFAPNLGPSRLLRKLAVFVQDVAESLAFASGKVGEHAILAGAQLTIVQKADAHRDS